MAVERKATICLGLGDREGVCVCVCVWVNSSFIREQYKGILKEKVREF